MQYNLLKNLGGVISENSPVILTGLAVGGLVSTTILGIKATPKAMSILEEEKHDKRLYCQPDEPTDLTRWEIIRATWKCYIPTAGVGAASIFCILQANSIHMRRTAAIASLYTITDTAFREYQTKVVETIGKNKELKIRDEISGDRVKKNPPGANEVILGRGEILCYDSLTGRYFKSSVETINRIINRLNQRILSEMYISLNEFHYELGLAWTRIGEDVGWTLDRGLLDIGYSTQLSPEGEPCLVLNYEVFPRFLR